MSDIKRTRGDDSPKRRQEFRVVCARFPDEGHRLHVHTKRDLARAKQSVIDSDHHSEMMSRRGSRHWYTNEAPHRIQVREVSEWVDFDDEGVE